MKSRRELQAWIDSTRADGLDILRMYLGVALVVRGALFISDGSQLTEMVSAAGADWFVPMTIAHYVILGHLVGGFCLALGLLTRLAALVQVPILFGAVFFVHMKDGLLSAGQSLELSAIVLFALALYSIYGAGRLSVDAYLFAKTPEEVEAQEAAMAHSHS